MKIFIAPLCSFLIQCPTPRYDAILKKVQDDRKAQVTSDLYLQGDSPPRTDLGLLYTIFISSSNFFSIMIFSGSSLDWAMGS